MTNGDNPRVLDSLALAYYLSGDPAKAAAAQRRALAALDDRDPQLRAELEKKLAKYLAEAESAGLLVDDEE